MVGGGKDASWLKSGDKAEIEHLGHAVTPEFCQVPLLTGGPVHMSVYWNFLVSFHLVSLCPVLRPAKVMSIT